MFGRRKLRLELSAEFGDWDLPELGHPTGVFRGRDRLTAIASRFGHLYWPGRAIYGGQRLTERLSIYRGSERVAVFDDARYWINDVCFHPTKPWAIVGTGNYDGGYQFVGALLIFDYEANEYWSVLEEDRDVTRCRFDNDDLVVLLRPRNDQEFEADDEFAVFVGTRLTDLRPGDQNRRAHALLDPPLEWLKPCSPSDFGFDQEIEDPVAAIVRADLEFWASETGLTYADRSLVWDLCWLVDGGLVAVHESCLAEVWSSDGKLIHTVQNPPSDARDYGRLHGAQLFCAADGRQVFVNCVDRGSEETDFKIQSLILALDPVSGATRELAHLEQAHVLEWIADGHALARNAELARHVGGEGLIIAPDGTKTKVKSGHYDCFNHYLRIDGADEFVFLRGTPPDSHERKVVCTLKPGEEPKDLWPLNSKGFCGGHLMNSDGARLPNGDLVLCSTVYHPDPYSKKRRFIERRRLADGRALWVNEMPAQPARMQPIEGADAVAIALADGTLMVVDATNGRTLFSDNLAPDGVATVPLSIAVRGNDLAVGTIDGRILQFHVAQ